MIKRWRAVTESTAGRLANFLAFSSVERAKMQFASELQRCEREAFSAGIAGVALHIRPAQSSEAAALTELAVAAKKVWPYPKGYVDACRSELQVGADYLNRYHVRVAEVDGEVVAFYSLVSGTDDYLTLDHFWVTPRWQRRGIGTALWPQILEDARCCSTSLLLWTADPFAQGFYRKMGGRLIGWEASSLIAGMWLPHFSCPV